MTREEEIKKQADIYTDDASNYAEWSDDGGWSDTNDIELIEKAFIEGAEWADKTMIEKACEWLRLNTNWDDEWDNQGRNMNYGKIREFLKAMEE